MNNERIARQLVKIAGELVGASRAKPKDKKSPFDNAVDKYEDMVKDGYSHADALKHTKSSFPGLTKTDEKDISKVKKLFGDHRLTAEGISTGRTAAKIITVGKYKFKW
jgi:hypothetical protein